MITNVPRMLENEQVCEHTFAIINLPIFEIMISSSTKMSIRKLHVFPNSSLFPNGSSILFET